MDDTFPPLKISRLLQKYNLRPDKSLGQNFLIDEVALQRITEAAGILPGEAVLEIGAGLGSLTRHLANAAQGVIAIEIDDRLLPPLREVLTPFENIEIIHGDILSLNPDQLFPETPYVVVANIPYYITSAIIRHILEAKNKPRCIVLTVQLEVAKRICEEPGNLSLLALSVQVYGEPKVVARIPAGAFHPAPKVDSAVVLVDLYSAPRIATESLSTFFQLAKAGFGQKRKTLLNSISAGMAWPKEKTLSILEKANIDPQRRAQTLSLEEWDQLVKAANSSQA